MKKTWTQTWLLACCAGLIIGVSACSTFVPSRPVSDLVNVRNTSTTVEVMICAGGTVQPVVMGRGLVGETSKLLPLPADAFPIARGIGFSLGDLTSLPVDSPLLTPLDGGERLGLTLRVQDGDRSYRLEGEFRVAEEQLAAFARGEWLGASGDLRPEPCGP